MWKTKGFLWVVQIKYCLTLLCGEGRGGTEHREGGRWTLGNTHPQEIQSHNSVVQSPKEWSLSPWVWPVHPQLFPPLYLNNPHSLLSGLNENKNNDTPHSLLNSSPLIFDKCQLIGKGLKLHTNSNYTNTGKKLQDNCPEMPAKGCTIRRDWPAFSVNVKENLKHYRTFEFCPMSHRHHREPVNNWLWLQCLGKALFMKDGSWSGVTVKARLQNSAAYYSS